jgi:hypothetical protein
MPNYSLNRNRRMYLHEQTTPLTVPTAVTADYCLFTKLTLDPISAAIKDPSITGSRGELKGVPGRKSGTWAIDGALHGSGAAGTAPQAHVLLKAALGHEASVAMTSTTYTLVDDITSFALFNYRTDPSGGTGLTQQIGMGCVVSDITFNVGQDVHSFAANGRCIYVIDSDNFATDDSTWLGGLMSFPAEPTAPTSLPQAVTVGFTGSITTDSNSIIELKTATIKLTTGNDIVDDTFSTYIGSGVQGNTRMIDVSLTLDDSDDSAIADLKTKARTFSPIDIVIQCGTITGSIFTYTLKQVQMVEPKFTDGPKGRVRVDFGASGAHGTTLAGLDAFKIVCT